jgi:hypothetical protein
MRSTVRYPLFSRTEAALFRISWPAPPLPLIVLSKRSLIQSSVRGPA